MQLGRTRCSHGQWTVKCSYKHKQNTCIITLTNFKNRFKVSIIHWSLFFICFRNQTAPHKSKFLICPLLTRSLMWSVNWNPQPNTRSVKFCTIYTKTNATNIKINNGKRMQEIDQHFNSWQSFFFNFNSTLFIFTLTLDLMPATGETDLRDESSQYYGLDHSQIITGNLPAITKHSFDLLFVHLFKYLVFLFLLSFLFFFFLLSN